MLSVIVATTYGENLRKWRKKRGYTQEELAEKMGLERQGNLAQYENNKKFPTPDLIRQHAKALGCHTGDLLQDVDTPYDGLRKGLLTERKHSEKVGNPVPSSDISTTKGVTETGGSNHAGSEQHPATRIPDVARQAAIVAGLHQQTNINELRKILRRAIDLLGPEPLPTRPARPGRVGSGPHVRERKATRARV
jgi:transcriptional regulator with XRE-family HTH domain